MYRYLATLIQWRKFILTSGVIAAVIAAIVSILLPKWYTASTSVFPPEPKSSISPYAQILQSLQTPILGPTAIGARPGTIYIDILKSRKVGERLIEKYGFMKIYGAGLMTDAIEVLQKHTSYSLLENGLLIISFEDRDPQRASEVTNDYVKLLDEFNRELNISRASKTKDFIAGQLERHETEMRAAEEALQKYQQENEAIELTQQTRAIIDIVAGLTGEAVKLEVELEILRNYTSKESEEYIRKKKNYDELVAQLNKFKVDSTRSDDDVIRSYFPTLDKVPEISLNYARLLRNVKVGEKVFELLVKEYEQARIEEARDTPTVQILDDATPPELKSRPKRKQIVIIGGILGLAWASVIALFAAFFAQEKSQTSEIRRLLDPMIQDVRKLFRRK